MEVRLDYYLAQKSSSLGVRPGRLLVANPQLNILDCGGILTLTEGEE